MHAGRDWESNRQPYRCEQAVTEEHWKVNESVWFQEVVDSSEEAGKIEASSLPNPEFNYQSFILHTVLLRSRVVNV